MHPYLFDVELGNWKRGCGRDSTYLRLCLFVQSEAECRGGSGVKLGGGNRKGGLVGRSDNGVVDQVKDMHTWSSRHSSVEAPDCFAASLVSSSPCWCVFAAYQND